MTILFMLLGGLCCLAALGCHIIILIDAFKNELWKGIVGLFCGLYLLYYGIVEYQADNKTTVLLIWLLGGIAGSILVNLGGAFAHHGGI